MKLSATVLAIMAIVTPSLAFSPGVGVRVWSEYNGQGQYAEFQNEGGCQNLPGYINDKVKSIAIYPGGYHCDFWLDANCNNSGNDGGKCVRAGGRPDSYGPGVTNVGYNLACKPAWPYTSFKCYKP